MAKYVIAQEGDRVGEVKSTLRAEINLGLKKGYAGFLQEKEEVISFLKEEYRQALAAGLNFIPVGIQQTDLVYAYPVEGGVHAEAEPSLTLFADRNPLYSTESEEEWQAMVEDLASKLAEKFDQFRVYVTYIRVEVKIFQKA
ncbi:MAG: hypothetical protein WCT08_02620 [Patescibacteria group bacterium]|jgi:hypothetical protein